MKVLEKRVRRLNSAEFKASGNVVYWMSRDQRVQDNWALFYAQQKAGEIHKTVEVVFCLKPGILNSHVRNYLFMLEGLKQVAIELAELNIKFSVLLGEPDIEIDGYLRANHSSILVSDFSPLRIKQEWNNKLIKKLDIPYYEVDTHNIIPVWLVSDKQEFAAYTIRPKIHRLLDEYLDDFPVIKKQKPLSGLLPIQWGKIFDVLKFTDVSSPKWIKSGNKIASETLKDFISCGLENYDTDRNDPTKLAQSNLSPYLHFGHISAQRIMLELKKAKPNLKMGKEYKIKYPNENAFIEELVVRRELAENYCFYNFNYDNYKGLPAWARISLDEHKKDKREHVYVVDDFEQACTHDELWNAAQKEMLYTGKMHGYMRMYWAKKILEWTTSPDQAIEIAVLLNDKYELDGRDPNGYAGIAWAIGGLHDRPWIERKIFGKIRYMNFNGCKRKFDVAKYIEQVDNIVDQLS